MEAFVAKASAHESKRCLVRSPYGEKFAHTALQQFHGSAEIGRDGFGRDVAVSPRCSEAPFTDVRYRRAGCAAPEDSALRRDFCSTSDTAYGRIQRQIPGNKI